MQQRFKAKTAATGRQLSKHQRKSQRPSTSLVDDTDDVITSEDEDETYKRERESESENDDSYESPETKRKRLAKEYLKSAAITNRSDDEDSISDSNSVFEDVRISDTLRKDRLLARGSYYQDLSSSVSQDFTEHQFSGQRSSFTSVVVSKDEKNIFSGSKDGQVILWDTVSGSKLRSIGTSESGDRHKSDVLATASSSDSVYYASGGRDSFVRIYDFRTKNGEIHCFKGHRDAVTCLAFQNQASSLFSGSLDRCIKHWNIGEMGYMETLYGHQDGVHSIDCWNNAKPISSSSDRTVRAWKISEESHLVFRGHKSNIDSVQVINDNHFISAGQDGSINLWKDSIKSPITTVQAAHGHDSTCTNPRWISSMASVKMSNIVATGSNCGRVRLWDVNCERKTLMPIRDVPIAGFINGISLTPNLLVAATGAEHRLGRWWHMKGNKNKIVVVRFNGVVKNGDV